jgi:hypothetical protein
LLQQIKAPSAFFCCISRYENKELKRQNFLSVFFCWKKKKLLLGFAQKFQKKRKKKVAAHKNKNS